MAPVVIGRRQQFTTAGRALTAHCCTQALLSRSVPEAEQNLATTGIQPILLVSTLI